jgi:sulfur relay (sulfurtransferase) complex TusBCD TusD component (DsrE family)
MQSVSKKGIGKHVPAETNTRETLEGRCFRCRLRRGVILKTINWTSSVVSCLLKVSRLGGWCEMVASLVNCQSVVSCQLNRALYGRL